MTVWFITFSLDRRRYRERSRVDRNAQVLERSLLLGSEDVAFVHGRRDVWPVGGNFERVTRIDEIPTGDMLAGAIEDLRDALPMEDIGPQCIFIRFGRVEDDIERQPVDAGVLGANDNGHLGQRSPHLDLTLRWD